MTPPRGPWAVVPAFNEAATLGDLVRGVRSRCGVIVVDDGSTDGSGAVAVAAGADVIRHARRRGKGAALRTGFAAALRRGAPAVVTLDGDAQHDPADLPRLLQASAAAPDALIVGDRLAGSAGDPMPLARRLAVRTADRMLARLLPAPIRDSQCGFRVYPAAFLRAVALREEGFVLETEALVRAVQGGYRVLSVPVRRLYPVGRRSRFRSLADTTRIAWFLLHAQGRRAAIVATAPTRYRGRARLGTSP